MVVYLCQAGGLPIVKIGKADDALRRIAEHQCAHWEVLKLLRQWEGGLAAEYALHLRFAELRIRGEWFAFSRAMMGDVGLVEIPLLTSEPQPAIESTPLSAFDAMDLIRSRRGLMAKVSAGLGVTRAAVTKWERVPAELLPEVERIIGIPRQLLRPDICPPQNDDGNSRSSAPAGVAA